MNITLTPKQFTSAFEMQPLLSDTEIELLTELREVDNESFWGVAIREVACAKKVKKEAFRNLVCQLKSQAFDNPVIMQKIIGTEAYNLLMTV